MTFSIAARCPRTGMLGVATSSKALAAGASSRTAGAASAPSPASRSSTHISGSTASSCSSTACRRSARSRALIEGDPGRDLRQLAIVDKDGRTAAYTGERCIPWAGQVVRCGLRLPRQHPGGRRRGQRDGASLRDDPRRGAARAPHLRRSKPARTPAATAAAASLPASQSSPRRVSAVRAARR